MGWPLDALIRPFSVHLPVGIHQMIRTCNMLSPTWVVRPAHSPLSCFITLLAWPLLKYVGKQRLAWAWKQLPALLCGHQMAALLRVLVDWFEISLGSIAQPSPARRSERGALGSSSRATLAWPESPSNRAPSTPRWGSLDPPAKPYSLGLSPRETRSSTAESSGLSIPQGNLSPKGFGRYPVGLGYLVELVRGLISS